MTVGTVRDYIFIGGDCLVLAHRILPAILVM
jgi:hypothetical protein